MNNVLIIDTETSGLDPQKDVAIEVAAVVYNLPYHCVLETYSSLIKRESNESEAINHIQTVALAYANNADYAWAEISLLANNCEAILAHNGDFDRQFIPSQYISDMPWIDTCGGITWPMQEKPGQSLIGLALAHGLGVVDPHRALSDCMLIARLLTRCAELGHDLDKLLARGLRPTALFQALVSFDEKDKAKEAGFHWDAPSRRWLRKMAVEDAAKLGFSAREVEA